MNRLQGDIPAQEFNLWIRPLHAVKEAETLRLLAPNRFVLERVKCDYREKIQHLIGNDTGEKLKLKLEVGSKEPDFEKDTTALPDDARYSARKSSINKNFSFQNFVAGDSNQLAYAASAQVAEKPGRSYNPLFICGGVGLGKTHLMHAIGNALLDKNRSVNIVYVRSERFLSDMSLAYRHKTMDAFKRYYRRPDVLLLDDIQFFAGKTGTQEEFFHTFNTLIEQQKQVILSCDQFPKEVEGIENRLKSRFSSGLTVSIEPPDLETRIAILQLKAESLNIPLSDEVASFVARHFRSNVRELEGALNRIVAHANFTCSDITLELSKTALHDLLLVQDKRITIEDIQKTTAKYFNIRVADLSSKSRKRSVTRPRQIAMSLAKDLTNISLPEIGDNFGGRNHTTVLHACQKVTSLRKEDQKLNDDYVNLSRLLSN